MATFINGKFVDSIESVELPLAKSQADTLLRQLTKLLENNSVPDWFSDGHWQNYVSWPELVFRPFCAQTTMSKCRNLYDEQTNGQTQLLSFAKAKLKMEFFF